MVIPDFLTHYYDKEAGPFRSMTEGGAAFARQLFSSLQKGTGAKSKFTPDYIGQRTEVEEWLRNEFISRGGKPARKNPIYTILGSCDWLLDWYENGVKEIIPLSAIKNKQVSFTYPDSMVSYQMAFKMKSPVEYYGKLYLFAELEDILSRYGLPKGKITNGKPDPDMYIEMQIWEDIK